MPDTALRVESVAGVPCCRPARRRPSAVLAWSEARVDEGLSRGPTIALWLPEGATVAIGIGQKPETELEVEAMRRDGVGLIRRQSGGGAVLLYPGVMCWEAWASLAELEALSPGGSGIRQAYAALSLPVVEGLARLGVEAFHAGICDVSTRRPGDETARKLAGTAQLRRREMVLVHGSLLINPDLDLLVHYLKFPSEQPDYRRGRSHRDFCVSVAEAVGADGDDERFVRTVAGAVVTAAQAAGWEAMTPPGSLEPAALKLEKEKYLSEGWNWERLRPPPSAFKERR